MTTDTPPITEPPDSAAQWQETVFGDHLAILRSISQRYPGIGEAQESPSTIYLISVILQLALDNQQIDAANAARIAADREARTWMSAHKVVTNELHEALDEIERLRHGATADAEPGAEGGA